MGLRIMEMGRPGGHRSPKTSFVVKFGKVSKWEFELGNRENLPSKVCGRLRGGLWTALHPFLERPGTPEAWKRSKIQVLPPHYAIYCIYYYWIQVASVHPDITSDF